ncbi:MAG: hypothetical protein AAGE76_01130 [Pseudomonadota bacterium]
MITVLSDDDLIRLVPDIGVMRAAVETGLQAQAEGRALAEPTTVFNPVPGRDDLIAVIKGSLPDAGLALVKTVGGFPGNADKGLATNPGCLTLIETETGQVSGLMPAARITTDRTAMVTAIGALRLARTGASVLGCIGTRGISVHAVRYISQSLPLSEVRLHGRDPDICAEAAGRLSTELGIAVRPTPDWATCFDGADILIDGAALPSDAALFPAEAIRPGAVMIAFGAYSAFPTDIMDHLDGFFMDRWVDDGRGALGPQTGAGTVSEDRVDAFIGDVIAGRHPGRGSDTDRLLFVHRGVAACDLALAQRYLEAAQTRGLGTQIPF